MESAPSDAVACPEKITVLHLLHHVPCPPRFNPVPRPFIDSNTSYSLPFNRKRDLCATPAFLSGITEGPDGIPALCLHESPQGTLDILIVVNVAKCGQGHHRLDSTKAGFDNIFSLLSTSSHEDETFAAGISMCHRRICCRLRFVARKKSKTEHSRASWNPAKSSPLFQSPPGKDTGRGVTGSHLVPLSDGGQIAATSEKRSPAVPIRLSGRDHSVDPRPTNDIGFQRLPPEYGQESQQVPWTRSSTCAKRRRNTLSSSGWRRNGSVCQVPLSRARPNCIRMQILRLKVDGRD